MEFRRIEHGLVDSTSERAFAALAGDPSGRTPGSRHGDVHLATGQTAGRGRRGATWVSEPGLGLYASVVLRPRGILDPAALTMGAGLAVRSAVVALGLREVELKWPNDLLVRGAKLAGILAETRGLDPRAPHCVLGIGVNVAQREFPAELRAQRAVTSLALCGIECTADALLERLLPPLGEQLERIESEPAAVLRDYHRATGLAGECVRVTLGDRELVGRWIALELDRGLVLDDGVGPPTFARLEHVRALSAAEARATSLHSPPPNPGGS